MEGVAGYGGALSGGPCAVAAVERSLERLRPQIAARQVQVRVDRVPRAWGRVDQLSHVVDNLLSNAVKYVPAGRGKLLVEGGQEGGFTRLCVQDNGIGIPAAYQQRIFDLFGRVPDEERTVDGAVVEGTGVGLAIVKRIVEAHGGLVEVWSREGEGSRFTVRLPVPSAGHDDPSSFGGGRWQPS